MITANDAKNLSESGRGIAGLAKAEKLIREAANSGETSVLISADLISERAAQELAATPRSFRVKRISDNRDGDYYEVKW